MPKRSKKTKKKVEGNEEKKEETEEGDETEQEMQKTSIQISTKLRDRLWRLKFRHTYDEFLWELCNMYEKSAKEE